jgi:hypothetical protein
MSFADISGNQIMKDVVQGNTGDYGDFGRPLGTLLNVLGNDVVAPWMADSSPASAPASSNTGGGTADDATGTGCWDFMSD